MVTSKCSAAWRQAPLLKLLLAPSASVLASDGFPIWRGAKYQSDLDGNELKIRHFGNYLLDFQFQLISEDYFLVRRKVKKVPMASAALLGFCLGGSNGLVGKFWSQKIKLISS